MVVGEIDTLKRQISYLKNIMVIKSQLRIMLDLILIKNYMTMKIFNQKYAINIFNYHEDKTANVIRHSQYNATRKPIYLNLYMDHFSYIANIKKLIKLYICETCAKKFNDNKDLAIHQDKCSKE